MTKQQQLDLKYLDSNSNGLSEWEQDFIGDLIDKEDGYQLSAKQCLSLDELIDKV